MKKKEKTVCQIIRFRGNIETFIVSIDLFASSRALHGSYSALPSLWLLSTTPPPDPARLITLTLAAALPSPQQSSAAVRGSEGASRD